MSILKRTIVAVVTLLTGFVVVPASATVFSYSSSSVIDNGNGYDGLGLFGSAGASLVGATYTLTTTFDTDGNSYTVDNGYNENWSTGAAPFHFSLKVNGITYSGASFGITASEGIIANTLSATNTNFDWAITNDYSYDTSGNFLWITQQIQSYTDPFVGQSRNFGESRSYSSIADATSSDYFSFSNSHGITFLNTSGHTALIQINGGPDQSANVPEPESIVLFGIGMLGFAASRRKRAKSAANNRNH